MLDNAANGTIALGRATPRAWLSDSPTAHLVVAEAPVSRQLLQSGRISFAINATAASKQLHASIDLGGGGAGSALRQLSLRFRAPLSWGRVASLTVGGEDMVAHLRGGETLELPLHAVAGGCGVGRHPRVFTPQTD